MIREVYYMKEKKNSRVLHSNERPIWEELDNMTMLPKLDLEREAVTVFLNAMRKLQEEEKLLHFLNALDEEYGPQRRSQILLMNPLPSVEVACAIFQQEEIYREVLDHGQLSYETRALMSKSHGSSSLGKETDIVCDHCEGKGHTKDRCWQLIAYPSWHSKSKEFPQRRGKDGAKIQKGGRLKDGGDHSAAQVSSSATLRQGGELLLSQDHIAGLMRIFDQGSTEMSSAEDFDRDKTLLV